MVLSNFRFAAGVCVLATGLFLGGAGGAIAVAAADSHGSNTHGHAGANGSSQDSGPASSVNSPPSSITNTVRGVLPGVSSTLRSGPKSGLQDSTGATGPQTLPGGTNITGPKNEPNPVAAAPNAPTAVPNVGKQNPSPVAQTPNGAAPVTNALAPAPKPLAPVTNAGATAANPPATAANPLATAANPPATAANPPATAANPPATAANPLATAADPLASLALSVITLVTDSVNVPVALVTDLANGTVLTAPIADLVEAIPLLLTPAFDAITVLQDIVTTVTHGVLPLIQLPSDIASLFGITLGLPPDFRPPTTLDYVPTVAASLPPAASAASPLPRPLPPLAPADVPDGPMVGNAAGLATLGGIAASHVSQASSLPDQAAPTPIGTRIEQALARVGRAIGEALRSVSLAELAAAALPGLGGLLIFTGAGVRAGHRQAKFGFAVHTAGIARFARTGPLGVVRSGGLVAIRRRKARAECRLDEAA